MEKDPSTNQLNARELTEAIDAATSFVAEEPSETSKKSDSEVARDLGRAAQFTEEQDVIASNNTVKQMVAVENGYAEAGDLTPGENVVGGESAIEIKERTEGQREAAKIASGVGLSKDQQWMHEIDVKNTKVLAASVESEVEKVPADANPNLFEKIRFSAMLRAIRMTGQNYGDNN